MKKNDDTSYENGRRGTFLLVVVQFAILQPFIQ